MIKGGTSAAGKTGAIRTGYTQVYLPCDCIAYSAAVKAKLESKSRASVYNALVKIEDLSGNQQLLTSCSYFQVQKYLSSGIDNGFLTIQKPEVWSIWGEQYTNLLKPSKRTVTIFAGIPGFEIPIFKGRITGYSESIGGNGGAINLYLSDQRVTLQRTDATQLEQPHTRYCLISRLASKIFADAGLALMIADVDAQGNFTALNDSLSAVNNALSGKPYWCSGDLMTIGTNSGLQIIGTDLLSVTDRVITQATRDLYDSSAYNVVKVTGLDNGSIITDEVLDASDVSDRGRIVYSSVIGSELDDISIARAQATQMIARALAGRLSASIVFNPYLIPGQVINFQSDRFNISQTTASLTLVRHQYQHGDCSTALDGLEVQL